ncbi:calx-beta domain protein, partial [Vibrio parahaemolyticus V-223/04]
WKATPPQSTP